MKAYGEESSQHIAVCRDCKEEKVVRWHLTTAQEEVEVCDDCYLGINSKTSN